MKRRGRPIMAAIFGFLAGLFAAVSLLAFGIIPLESILVTILPVAAMFVAFALAMWAPIGATPQTTQTPQAPQPPQTPQTPQAPPTPPNPEDRGASSP